MAGGSIGPFEPLDFWRSGWFGRNSQVLGLSGAWAIWHHRYHKCLVIYQPISFHTYTHTHVYIYICVYRYITLGPK